MNNSEDIEKKKRGENKLINNLVIANFLNFFFHFLKKSTYTEIRKREKKKSIKNLQKKK